MKQLIFTIYDEKAEAFFPPFYMPNKSMAVRQFGDMVNDNKSQISLHPHDYTLFQLGQWDDNTSSFEEMKKTSIGNGVEFITPTEKDA